MTVDEPLYVYALAEPGLPRTLRIAGHHLRVVPIDGIDAIVGPHPATLDLPALQRQHGIVVALAERGCAVLPARVNSTVAEPALRAAVAARRETLLDALALVRNRRQMTIRLYRADPTPVTAPGAPESGTDFLERRRAAHRLEVPELATIRTVLGQHVAEERVEAGTDGARVVVHHLVEVTRLARYGRQASTLQRELPATRLRVSGPWPAFAFTPELL